MAGDVETDRLHLRRWDRRAHAAGLAAVNAHAEVMEFISAGVPLTRVESGLMSDRIAEHWRTYGFGLWAVIEKATGNHRSAAVAGRLGLELRERIPHPAKPQDLAVHGVTRRARAAASRPAADRP